MTTCIHSNHYLSQKQKGLIDLTNDSLILILMNNSFTFNRDTHATLADVSASQIDSGNGYTQNSITLDNPVHTEQDSGDYAQTLYDAISIIANGGSIGPTNGSIIYDSTTADNTIIGYIDFEGAVTVTDGNRINISTLYIRDL